MIVAASPDELDLEKTVICIGNFDGVHLGHQMLLRHMRLVADTLAAPSIVITFFPPTKVVFGRGYYLLGREEKLKLLARFDPTAVVVVPFDIDYAQTDKRVFLEQLARLRPHTIIVGDDFRFGYRRAGTLNDLSHLPERLEVFGMKRLDGDAVKSSRIRELLDKGQIGAANRLLGHSYLATGKVTKGERRGGSIGFPTANVNLPPLKALPLGVFAVKIETPFGVHGGMANVGPRPSFEGATPSLEVHIFDFDAELYDREITVHFEHYLRGQVKFNSLKELQEQLEKDRQKALLYLEK